MSKLLFSASKNFMSIFPSHCLLVSLHRVWLAPSFWSNSKDAIKHRHRIVHTKFSSA
jgi:hypothetical protein